jgi:hypothetical protein
MILGSNHVESGRPLSIGGKTLSTVLIMLLRVHLIIEKYCHDLLVMFARKKGVSLSNIPGNWHHWYYIQFDDSLSKMFESRNVSDYFGCLNTCIFIIKYLGHENQV